MLGEEKEEGKVGRNSSSQIQIWIKNFKNNDV